MKRYALLASVVGVGGALAYQGSYVDLQATTPGSIQTGHSNISGVAKSGSVIAYNSTPAGQTFGGDFRVTSNEGRGILGNASSTTGATYGGLFQSFSNAGRGIAGIAPSLTGTTYGGFFSSLSNQGRGVFGQASSASGTTYGVYGKATSASGFGVYSEGNMRATGTISGNGAGLTQLNASELFTGTVVDARLSGNVALLNVTNAFTGAVSFTSLPVTITGSSFATSGLNVTNSGDIGRAIGATASGDGATAIEASANGTGSSIAVNGTASGSGGIGIRGSGAAFGASFVSNGTGVSALGSGAGGSFNAYGSGGVAVLATADDTGSSTYGGYFSANSSLGYGLYARNQATSGTSYGLFGSTASPDGFALFGNGNAAITGRLGIGTGTTTPLGRLQITDDDNNSFGTASMINGTGHVMLATGRAAIRAQSRGDGLYTSGILATGESTVGAESYGAFTWASGSGTNYGIITYATGGTLNYAGYFNGDIYATSASAGIKAFMIDHPLDPANKVLSHSSIESDERMNLYRGIVKTDSKGFAQVTVPGWFDALNGDIQYQLTVVGDDSEAFVLVKVAQKLKNGKFRIRTSVPGTEVHWQVSGRRHDPTSEYYPLQVERLKGPAERGKYYSPEAYGKDPRFGIGGTPQRGLK